MVLRPPLHNWDSKDGFFGSATLKIPLPPSLQKAEQVLRMMGMGDQADELVLSMNRAAEAAVPEAKSLLVNAVKQMTVEDARGILTGGDTAATEFFRGKTEATLTKRFGPKVKAVTDKVGLAQQTIQYLRGLGCQVWLGAGRSGNSGAVCHPTGPRRSL